MTIQRLKGLSVLLAILLSTGSSPVFAADWGRGGEHHRVAPPARVERGLDRGYQLDERYHHDRFYPSRGMIVDRVPHDHVVVPYRGEHYYFHGGVWYRPYGPRFVVVAPPIGLTVSILPPFYTTLWVGGVPYYYADGTYYAWRPQDRQYVVVEPPSDSQVTSVPPEPEQLYIYPKMGQGEQQQATDRYECHRWAVDQSGFDPSQPGSGIPESQYGAKRADYQRATKACLEARGYSVR
jgi:hypothetical protein